MFRIATRQSPLALQQTLWVIQALKAREPDLNIELVKLITEGDKRLDISLTKIGGKGLFTKALDEALLKNEADIAVHSMKDVPNELPGGLVIGAVCLREEAHDVLLTLNDKQALKDLPKGAIVGTSSLRRQSQLLALRPDLQVKMLRGNVDTRVKKLQAGDYDAIILARAGLNRLHLTDLFSHDLPISSFIPCAGQGAIGIEYRLDDQNTLNKIIQLNHLPTQQCVLAEKTVSRYLGGSCQVPIAAYAYIENEVLTLSAMIGSPDGKLILKTQKFGQPEYAVEIGIEAAEELILQGANKILNTLGKNLC